MSFSFEIADRISFGNKKLLILNVTDVQDDSSSVVNLTGLNRVEACHSTNNTDTADFFTETIGSHGSQTDKKKVTLDAVTSDDDGHLWVWGR